MKYVVTFREGADPEVSEAKEPEPFPEPKMSSIFDDFPPLSRKEKWAQRKARLAGLRLAKKVRRRQYPYHVRVSDLGHATWIWIKGMNGPTELAFRNWKAPHACGLHFMEHRDESWHWMNTRPDLL